MKRKTIFVAALVAALSCGSALSSFAASWESVGADWKYVKDDGKYAAAEWVNTADGKWYYLKADTIMAKGWFLDPTDNHWYFLDSNGALVTGLIEVNSNVYYMNETHDGTYGALYEGVKVINGINYTFTVNGTTGSKPYTSKQYHSDGSAVAVRAAQAYSGSGSVPSQPSGPSIPEKEKEAENRLADVSERHEAAGIVIAADIVASKTVDVVVREEATDDAIQNAAKESVNVLMNMADAGTKAKVDYNEKEYTRAQIMHLIERKVTRDNIDLAPESVKVTIQVNGQDVTYTINLAEVK